MTSALGPGTGAFSPIDLEATERVILAGGLPLAKGVEATRVCKALNFIGQYVLVDATWFDAGKAQGQVHVQLADLDRKGVPPAEDARTRQALQDRLDARRRDLVRKHDALGLEKTPRKPWRPREISTAFYPWLLGLFELCFEVAPTATHHLGRSASSDSATLRFTRCALLEIEAAAPLLVKDLGYAVTSAWETPVRSRMITIPRDDSLRRAIQRALVEKHASYAGTLIPEKLPRGRPPLARNTCRNMLRDLYF